MIAGVIPVVTPEEMAAIDRAAPEPVEILIGRAGGAVAREAVRLLGGTYGRRVVVLAGKGNNGADGREAARRLRRLGASVVEVAVADAPSRLPPCDLVIDAAFGTGFRGSWAAPELPGGDDAPPVLAVDIPSGVDGATGVVGDETQPYAAELTVTFAALKPGLLLGAGAELTGEVELADIGLDVSDARCHLVTADDLAAWYPQRAPGAHKWQAAVRVVAGSPGMDGAAALVCAGAQRAGAGYVRLSTPGGEAGPAVPAEVVRTELSATGWAAALGEELERFGALVVGNGLGHAPNLAADVRQVVSEAPVPVVLDADGLNLLGEDPPPLGPDVVLTPHDGEFARLAGAPPGEDRLAATRSLAERTGAVVLLKGPCTVVAHPDGRVLLVAAGDERLATAGTGDVLAGIIGALCARGQEPFRAAAAGSFLQGAAADLGWRDGFVAGDLPALLPRILARGPAEVAGEGR